MSGKNNSNYYFEVVEDCFDIDEDEFEDEFDDEISDMGGVLKILAKDFWECSMSHENEEERRELLTKLTEIRGIVNELYGAVEALEV